MNNSDKSGHPELSGNDISARKEIAKATNEQIKKDKGKGSTLKFPPEAPASRASIANSLRIRASGNALPPTARWLDEDIHEGPWCCLARTFAKVANVNPSVCSPTNDKNAKEMEDDMRSLSMKAKCGSAKEMGARTHGRGLVVTPLTEIVRKARCGCRKAEANL